MNDDELRRSTSALKDWEGIGPVVTTADDLPPGVVPDECTSYEFCVLSCHCNGETNCAVCEGSGWFLEHYSGDYTPGSAGLRVWVEQHRAGNTPGVLPSEQSGFDRRLKRVVQSTKQASIRPRNASTVDIGFGAADAETSTVLELNFDVLPLSEHGWEILRQHYTSTAKRRAFTGRELEIDHERLRRIRQLKTDMCYIGRNKFDGYRVFSFTWATRVIAECPWKGNAIYVVSGEWMTILRHTKADVRKLFDEHITRVPHSGNWFAELNDALGYRGRPRELRYLA